jgi:ParB-like chromosome segregation protein Spo0J
VSARPVTLQISSLVIDGSPRIQRENEAHTQVLVEAGDQLPPIVVHQDTMHVIDGVHRVQAARRRGAATIDALLFEGDTDAAFRYAVWANITHGLPLSLADRLAAAERIVASHPEWSDRSVAATAGLSPSTVRDVRQRVAEGSTPVPARVGRDGRVRPLSAAEGRRRAAAVIAEQPQASLRTVAASAGISIGTARDVRERVLAGRDPVPVRSAATHQTTASPNQVREPSTLLAMLRSDPSLRYSQRGRWLIRWFESHVTHLGSWSRLVELVPPHSAYIIAELATSCANTWTELAHAVKSRAESL